MPIYEYTCDRCGRTFEVVTSIEERDRVRCPRCGEAARRLVSAFTVKGGWGQVGTRGGGGCGSGGWFTGGG